MNSMYFAERLYLAGYTDLVCVVPPGANIAPSSSILATHLGKVPGRPTGTGLWVGYDWRRHQTTIDDVRTWAQAGANFGLRADRFPGIDIDCQDPSIVEEIQRIALSVLGSAPIRIGAPPKRLLMYRTEAPFSRRRFWFEHANNRYLIEVLGAGQQYLVAGIHPKTQRAYEWLTDPTIQGASGLTPITNDDITQLFEVLRRHFEHRGDIVGITIEGSGRIATTPVVAQQELLAPSIDELRAAVRAIPNTNELFPDRTSYLTMGYAIKAAAGVHDEIGWELFSEWAARWEGNSTYPMGNDPDVVYSDWRRMAPPYRVGWGYIVDLARRFGYDDSHLYFDVAESLRDLEEHEEEENVAAPMFSDQWLADQVVRAQQSRLRFVPSQGRWLVWHGGLWRPDAVLLAEDVIKQELRRIAANLLRHGGGEKERQFAERNAKTICSASKATAVRALMQSDQRIAISPHILDQDPWILNTPAGPVNLKTGTLLAPNPDYFCTKTTAVAPDFSAPPTRWLEFLLEATGDSAEVVDYLCRLAGYCLTGSTREQQFTFIWGPGGNGKSVFVNTLTYILGDYAKVAPMSIFLDNTHEQHSTDLAYLAGARLVVSQETQAGRRWAEARVKAMTSGEPITARFIRQDNFTFVPQFKLVFVGNHQPEIRNLDAAISRRAHIVPFTVTPKAVDVDLFERLKAEAPRILAWAIRGCLEWQQMGLSVPEIVRAVTEEYLTEEDAIGRWIAECVIVQPGAFTETLELFESWRGWCMRNGEYVGSVKRFSKLLMTRKYQKTLHPQTRRAGFLDVALTKSEQEGTWFN